MAEEMQVFSNDEFGSVRTVMMDGEPWFVGKDVAEILGYSDTSGALKKHVDEDDKLTRQFGDSGQGREMYIINESGLYSLILSSKLPTAKKFKRWVTAEVLPSIRQNGMYGTDEFIEKSLEDPEWTIGLLTKYKESRQRVKALTETVAVQSQQIAELQPKATYYDTVLSCKDALPISVVAKDYGWSAQQMNKFLHERGVQYKLSGTWLLYAEHADKGYTKTTTHTYNDNDGEEHASVFTKWTQKGRLFIYDLMKKAGHLPLVEQENPSKQEQMQRQQRQAEGIAEAKREDAELKAQGKQAKHYKGRQPIAVDEETFRKECRRWRAGQQSARTTMRNLGLKANTFYRRVQQLGL